MSSRIYKFGKTTCKFLKFILSRGTKKRKFTFLIVGYILNACFLKRLMWIIVSFYLHINKKVKSNKNKYKPFRETVLVVSHEATRTGAPILSLNIVEALQEKYNVVSLFLKSGSIERDFYEVSSITVGPLHSFLASYFVERLIDLYKFKFAIVNSVESRAVLPALAKRFVPVISLIHEFVCNVRPKSAFSSVVSYSTATVFSTQLVFENVLAECPDINGNKIHIIPQGRCDLLSTKANAVFNGDLNEDNKILRMLRPEGSPEELVVVLGVGSVTFRKGVDLFIECANKVVKAGNSICRFVWIGKGYDPEQELLYSAYLADQINRSGLQEYVFFMNETPNLEVAYRNADILLITSRLDPLPNVAIDAMYYGVPVICFNKTTGIANFLTEHNLQEECVASYLDIVEMADRVLSFANSKMLRRNVGEKIRQLAIVSFDMKMYVEKLDRIVQFAINSTNESINEIAKSTLLRLDFFCPPKIKNKSKEDAIRSYVRVWFHGEERRKLFPGFHPGIYQEKHGVKKGLDPLADYLREGQPSGSWKIDVISSEDHIKQISKGIRIALHIHAFYIDLLPEILTRIKKNKFRPDLLISVRSINDKNMVAEQLVSYSEGNVDIRVVPNRGRDIAPLITEFGRTICDNYDFIGHIHTKKTIDIKDTSIINDWVNFLLENLIGGKFSMMDRILGRMADDAEIGIVFPDDPNVLDWGKNRTFADEISSILDLGTLTDNIIFPIGSMFWARVFSLEKLFNLNLRWEDYPSEPLPYDGSMLHAFERLFPLIVKKSGKEIVLTNVRSVTR
jgi:glycosyltransferase involved in cell wall biosynthesis